jgi:methionyl-tRNA synthetase
VKSFYITTPIYYVNSTPHIGHAYTTIAADILARHHKQRGEPTFFLTGTDEHASKVYRVAEEQGLDPKTYVDRIAESWKELPRLVDADYDFFIRTTDEGHKRFVQDFIQRIYDNGHIYQDTYAGLYCVGCEAFKTEAELVDGKCPEHGIEPEWIEETNYFFRLSAFQQQLLDLYDARPDFVLPRFRYNEARSFIAGGLQDFSLSRAGQPWGVPIPWDEEQVVYVWVDALINYLSALDVRARGRGPTRAVLAGGQAPDRQGHPPIPLRLLAGAAARRRVRRAQAALRARVPAARRPEDLEVGRQRDRPARPGRRVRQRRRALLGRACRVVRTGRQRHDREPARPLSG